MPTNEKNNNTPFPAARPGSGSDPNWQQPFPGMPADAVQPLNQGPAQDPGFQPSPLVSWGHATVQQQPGWSWTDPAPQPAGRAGDMPAWMAQLSNDTNQSDANAQPGSAEVSQFNPSIPAGPVTWNPSTSVTGAPLWNPPAPPMGSHQAVASGTRPLGEPTPSTGMIPYTNPAPTGMTMPFTPLGPTVTMNGSVTRQLTSTLRLNDGDASGSGATGMMKLAQPTKVIQVPVAGQPGRYVTGFLPVLEARDQSLPPSLARRVEVVNRLFKGHLKAALLIFVALVVLIGSVSFWMIQAGPQRQTNKGGQSATDQGAMQSGQTNSDANVILTDALSQNIHNWRTGTDEGQTFVFKDGAYHIVNESDNAALAVLPDEVLPKDFVYTLTTRHLKGDTGSDLNRVGLIFNYNNVRKGGKSVISFYCFEVINKDQGSYQLVKYDSSQDDNHKWTTLWPGDPANNPKHFGKEFHAGTGKGIKNTFTVSIKGSKFTFSVNGKQVGTAEDKSLKPGWVGMLVNLKGSEVAFTNLSLTYK